MRIHAMGMCLAAGLVAMGCAHNGSAQRTGEKVEGSFAEAYQAVQSGGKQALDWGEYRLERLGEGSVRVYRGAQSEAQRVAGGLSDALLTARVKARLAEDPVVRAGDIDVDTDAGVVTMRGNVASPDIAARAVQSALSAEGVFAVNSELSWGAGATLPESDRQPASGRESQPSEIEREPGVTAPGTPSIPSPDSPSPMTPGTP